jgi:SAM-dependent methyltransferase
VSRLDVTKIKFPDAATPAVLWKGRINMSITELQPDLVKKCEHTMCRTCGAVGLEPVLDLGLMPLSDGLLTENQLNEPEGKYPLEVAFCRTCSLVQIIETVPPETLFCQDYPYYSSFSDALLMHSRENVLELIERRQLTKESYVIELASNDGYLLKNYVENGIGVLGIDPAEGPAREAEKIGVSTLNTFFGNDLARQLVGEGKQADVIHANNVLAHVSDINDFVEGIRILLKDSGVAVIEVPYVRDLIDNGEFDTIYHEHLCYFSVTALERFFRCHNLYLNDIRWFDIHGGSLRLYIELVEKVGVNVKKLLQEEEKLGVNKYPYYEDFGQRVQTIQKTMQELLAALKAKGKRIAGYGAAAKGTIMLNYLGAGTNLIEYVVDRNVHKHGKYMPGTHNSIFDPQRLLKDKPDYVVILPWNFKDEIIAQQAEFRRNGGRFIVPIPEPHIV